ncbi:MAG: hypothetical protein ABJA76_12665 [Mucilaginibacter sp.]
MKTTMTLTFPRTLCALLMFIAVLSLNACKKDALEIKVEKTYAQARTAPATDLVEGGITLTLKPDGTAGINPGGDIVWSSTYDISGKKITVKVRDLNTTYKFTVISDEEIHGEHGEILKLISQ